MLMEQQYPALHREDLPVSGAYASVDSIDRPVGKLLARSLQVPEAEFLVANAHPDVVAAANQRCPSNAEDGVACVLETLLTTGERLTRPG